MKICPVNMWSLIFDHKFGTVHVFIDIPGGDQYMPNEIISCWKCLYTQSQMIV